MASVREGGLREALPVPSLKPFFVADRPASLRILRGARFGAYEGPLGIMSHANTSDNFQQFLADFPCGSYCRNGHDDQCRRLRDRGVIKICDSGVFTKEGCTIDYPELFRRYERMGVDYGIIIDYMRDSARTIRSARSALRHYAKCPRPFSLVAVSQGRSVPEYLRCYDALRGMGYRHIAIGGLLKRRRNTSHYVHLRGDGMVYRVLDAIRKVYPHDWLFALGCYNPSRHLRFEQLGLFGSDYKGWMFNYDPQDDLPVGLARRSRYAQVRRFLAEEIFEGPLYLNGAQREVARAKSGGKTLVIVACGWLKVWDERPDAGPTAARDAYVGRFFVSNRSYAERFGDAWAILSARHGLVKPEFQIPENYDTTFSRRSSVASTRRIREQVLRNGFHRYARIVVLGGKEYGAAVAEAYTGTGIPVLRPLEAFHRIGEMHGAVVRSISEDRPLV